MGSFALISDIHANSEALEAVLTRIDRLGVEKIRCLGDIVGYGAEPGICTAMVMERCEWTIMGNHDWGLFHGSAEFNPLARHALQQTAKKMRPRLFSPGRKATWGFLRNLPDHMQDEGFVYYHGSPRQPIMEYVLKSDGFLEPEKMTQIFSLIDRPCFVGHTHWPGIHRADLRWTQAKDGSCCFDLEGEPAIVNIGSVGQPRDGDPRASFAVVDSDRVEIHRVSYDIESAQRKILAAGLHPALAERLGRGR